MKRRFVAVLLAVILSLSAPVARMAFASVYEDVYTIQAGVFANFDNARRNYDRLKKLPDARVEEIDENYVLRVGKFSGPLEGQHLLKKVRSVFNVAYIRKTAYQEERIVLPKRVTIAQAETAVKKTTSDSATKDVPKDDALQNSPEESPAKDATPNLEPPQDNQGALKATATKEIVPLAVSLRQQGLDAEAGGNWDAASRIYREILIHEPGDADLWMRIGEIETNAGNFDEGIEDFQKAAALSPNNARIFAGLSRTYSSLNNPRQAFVAIERAVQIEPENVQYLEARAQIAAWTVEYAAAADSYERLAKLRPEDDAVLLDRARVESWQGLNDKSVRLYRKYLKKRPDNMEALLELVKVEAWRGNYSEALDLLEKYKEKEGVTDEYLKQKARVLAWADRPQAALEINGPLLNKMPEDYEVNFTNTIALYYVNRFRDSVESLAILNRMKPGAKETNDVRKFVLIPLRSFVEAGFSFYHDTDTLSRYHSYLKGSYQLNPETRMTAMVIGDLLHANIGSGLEKVDGQENAWHESAQIGIAHRFLPEVAADAYVGAASTEGNSTVPYGIGAEFRFIDALSFRIDRNFGFYVDSPRTLSLGIKRGLNHISAQWTPDISYTVAMMIGYNDYSDGNKQWEATLAPRRAVLRSDKLNLDIGLSLERQGFRERLVNGYYDPALYQRYTVQTLWFWKINDDNGVSFILGYGIQKDETLNGFRETYDANVEGTFGLYRDWMLKVNLAAFHSLRQTGPYNAYSAGAALTRRF